MHPAMTRRAGPSSHVGLGLLGLGKDPGNNHSAPPTEVSSISVTASTNIPGNVYVGPYCGELLLGVSCADHRDRSHNIQVKYSQDTLLLDRETERSVPFWLAYVQPARDRHEQNLEAVRDSRGLVFYRTMRQIVKGEELLAWYSDDLARERALPILTPSNIRGEQHYTCTKCLKSYQYPNTLKAHMRFHCTAHSPAAIPRLGMYLPPGVISPYSTMDAAASELSRLPAASSSASSASSSSSLSSSSSSTSEPCRDRSPAPAPREPRAFKHGATSAFSPHRKSREPEERDLRGKSPVISRSGSSSPCISSTECSPMNKTEDSERKENIGCFSFRPYDLPNKPNPSHHNVRSFIQPAVSLPLPQTPAFRYLSPWYPHLYSQGTCGATYPSMSLLGASASLFSTSAALYAHNLQKMANPISPETLRESIPYRKPLIDNRDSSSPQTSPTLPVSTFNFPMLSDKAGEPLDLLPRSLYMSKSRKGHLCIYCGKLYSRKYGLKIHLRTHTGYKPLKCKVCLRPFGDPSNLNKHIRLHAEGDTPYRCEYCGKVLVRRRDLERHIKSRHPSKVEGNSEHSEHHQPEDEVEKHSDDDDSLNDVDSCGDSMDDMECKEEIVVV